jgi:Fe-S-cluster formation regulator IscX/YfhJ
MNILNIFPKSREKLIESLEFSYFLFEAHNHLKKEYPRSQNTLIKSSLKVLDWCRSCQYNQVKDYKQLLTDYPFWESRQYYRERMRKFVAYELSTIDFVAEVLYPSLSNTNEARELKEDFRRQANIELDPKSFGFSKIISGLIPFLEGFDEDPEESFLTEEEFREIIQNSLMKLEKYFINES